MLGRSRRIVAAVVFSAGFISCGSGSQSRLDPPATGSQTSQPLRSAPTHKAAIAFAWTHHCLRVSPGYTVFADYACASGGMPINAGYETAASGEDIMLKDSYPDTRRASWIITAKNNGNREEPIVIDLLCATGS